ncbi:hypothetical protein [Arthrobacter mobilis]|uniref:Uncharacterized protein n=1 Tax=Arthrobacter mobilis TaxID=2724944 RepID=A0A7X6K4S2_9MICC|nr:hypothetical protein [Arthrobacter mobilis]NKX55672.1 hypothetical protein [Arthrobacter mobilis]
MDFWTTTPADSRTGAGGEVRQLAQRLLECEARLLEVNVSLAGLELAAWESPAGQAFRRALAEKCLRVDDAADKVRAAAGQVGAFGQAVEAALAESLRFP